MSEVEELVRRFVDATMEKAEMHGARKDHRLYEEMRRAFQGLRATEEGRRAFRALLEHPSAEVRVWVAGQLLAEGDASVIGVVEEISKGEGLLAFSAQMTLQEYRKGSLGPPFPAITK